jgi:hypothetical protein
MRSWTPRSENLLQFGVVCVSGVAARLLATVAIRTALSTLRDTLSVASWRTSTTTNATDELAEASSEAMWRRVGGALGPRRSSGFNFLTNWGEQFERVKSYVAGSTGHRRRIVTVDRFAGRREVSRSGGDSEVDRMREECEAYAEQSHPPALLRPVRAPAVPGAAVGSRTR